MTSGAIFSLLLLILLTISSASILQSPSTPSLNTTLLPPQCHHIPTLPPSSTFNRLNCHILAQLTCQALHSVLPWKHPPRERWIWNDHLPDCAVGYYLPAKTPLPKLQQCEVSLGEIVETCGGYKGVNAGSMNVEAWPDAMQDGRAVVEGEEMYFVAARRLTR